MFYFVCSRPQQPEEPVLFLTRYEPGGGRSIEEVHEELKQFLRERGRQDVVIFQRRNLAGDSLVWGDIVKQEGLIHGSLTVATIFALAFLPEVGWEPGAFMLMDLTRGDLHSPDPYLPPNPQLPAEGREGGIVFRFLERRVPKQGTVNRFLPFVKRIADFGTEMAWLYRQITGNDD